MTSIGNLTYTYDANGRRTSMGGSLAKVNLPAAITSATYNVNNQLTNWNGTTLSYDLNGNMTYGSGFLTAILSAIGKDTPGTFLGVAGAQYAALKPVAQQIGGDFAKAIPGVGSLLTLASLSYDATKLKKDGCLSGL